MPFLFQLNNEMELVERLLQILSGKIQTAERFILDKMPFPLPVGSVLKKIKGEIDQDKKTL
jgi:hypothetical protein